MELHILSYYKALEFIPTKPTYAIRIFNTKKPREEIKSLAASPLYLQIAEYVFDEEPLEEYLKDPEDFKKIGYTPFTIETARTMLGEFLPFRNKAESLLIHCAGGTCRSPSIGLAFNDIFNFGYLPEDLSSVYKHRLEIYGVRRIPYPWFNNLLVEASKEFPEINNPPKITQDKK